MAGETGNEGLGKGSIDEMRAEQAAGEQAANPATDTPSGQGREDTLGKKLYTAQGAPESGTNKSLFPGKLAEKYLGQEAIGNGAEALALSLAALPNMPAMELDVSGRWSSPVLRNLLRPASTSLGEHFSKSSATSGSGSSFNEAETMDFIRRLANTDPDTDKTYAAKSEAEQYDLTRKLANQNYLDAVIGFKTGKLGELGSGVVMWTDQQATQIRIAAFLKGLTPEDSLGDNAFGKMVGRIAGAGRRVGEVTRSVGSRAVDGLKGIAGRGGGEPPTTPPGGTPPAAL